MSMERSLRKLLSVSITLSLSALFCALFFSVEVKAANQFTLYCDFQEVTSSNNVNNLVEGGEYIFGSMRIGSKEGVTSVHEDGAVLRVETLSNFGDYANILNMETDGETASYAQYQQYEQFGFIIRIDPSITTDESGNFMVYGNGVYPEFPEAGVSIVVKGANFDTAETSGLGTIGYLDEGESTPIAMTTYPEDGKTVVEFSRKSSPGWYFSGKRGMVLYDEGPNLYSFTSIPFTEDDIVVTRDPILWYDEDKDRRESGELAITPVDLNVLVKYGDSGYKLTDFEIDPSNNTIGPEDDTIALNILSGDQVITVTKTLEHAGGLHVGVDTTAVADSETTIEGMQEIMAMSYVYGDYVEDNEGFTRDDLAKVALGEYIDFHVDVTSGGLSEEENQLLESAVDLTDKTVGAVYDINVYKTYYEDEANYDASNSYKETRLTDFTYTQLTLKINNTVSEAFSNLTGFKLFRIHEKKDHTMEIEELPQGEANQNEHGEYFDFEESMTKIKIGAAKFSKFILIFDTPQEQTPPPTPQEPDPEPEPPTNDPTPLESSQTEPVPQEQAEPSTDTGQTTPPASNTGQTSAPAAAASVTAGSTATILQPEVPSSSEPAHTASIPVLIPPNATQEEIEEIVESVKDVPMEENPIAPEDDNPVEPVLSGVRVATDILGVFVCAAIILVTVLRRRKRAGPK